ncbi:TlyA family RNA methyltransferase [Phenylobacterium sp.]|jgi:23S rRNA (cytidine1920-2'-O)/16S rRNA (cytidine1409-2'-O)-methyltransferase|uniref:TlyA family RNA methyltransferase n=1 Tax=Phenylobacterium sp. TaxID=1871053 RepID=UPI000C8CB1CE|nr:TlyA family RNA methyltransferase [Phenylobacterium sp.]MAK83498.1 TlyA family rRNA (cytidine-2'-O)-methyltransferase [Phenylobacterium sp.]|tara:strand:- start:19328 stop:20062 length:735 start_codon:yes stop_codon:yes gene_type:complete
MGRKRADLLLVERGLFDSRAKARAAIEAGRVTAGGTVVRRPADLLDDLSEIVAEPAHPWVGRAALKLAHALELWPIPVENRLVLDVGASTGGFTEVCLSRGAARVCAVDVGRGQLHPKVAGDPRVQSLEATDARDLDEARLGFVPDLVVCDVSFIGLSKALPRALALAAAGADLVVLVKPQFEVGPAHVGKGGVVKDEGARARALDEARAFLTASGWIVNGAAPSPITGVDGNIEFLVWATKQA